MESAVKQDFQPENNSETKQTARAIKIPYFRNLSYGNNHKWAPRLKYKDFYHSITYKV